MSLSPWLNHMMKTRKRTSRGAALVEAAFVMIPLCVIIFGIIEFGFLFKDQLSINNAARSGARTASAEPLNTSLVTDTIAAIDKQGAGAEFGPDSTLCLYDVRVDAATPANQINATGSITKANCTAAHYARSYSWNGTTFTNPNMNSDFWAPWGSGPATNKPDTCLGDEQVDAIGVVIFTTHHSLTGFFPNIGVTQHTVIRMEPQQSAEDCNAS